MPRPSPDAVQEIATLAAKRAADSEARRNLDPDVVRLVVQGGFARHFVPVAQGGVAGSFSELLSAVALLGETCASTAWFASLAAATGRMAAFLPVEGQREVWAQGPDVVVVGALGQSGTAEPVPGGWRVRGQWPYVSGVAYADWALVCARTPVDGGHEPWFFAVPRAAFGIADTWFNAGMRATGSNTLVLAEVVVPRSRSVALADLFAGRAPDAQAACHQVPMKAANGLTLVAPLLGAARGAVSRWVELVAGKLKGPAAAISGGINRSVYELTLARADGELDAVELLLRRVAEVADRGDPGPVLTVRNGRDCALAADLLAGVVDRLIRSSGSRGQAENEPLQRFWRDVTTGAGHAGLQLPAIAGAYASRPDLLPAAPTRR
ncbi:hydrolase [Micromonospora endophytica]|uniref:Hydrolase n=1 Tax=Micromonospora endophytica TaxID=515350 RepID=A0A2W2DB85_9ACTN|nr:hydrolase [Micromonospora endophytica]PZG01209.1 hydrolase [Micromonospora endophytica]RIW45850.1 hydrolase [Micromonospora endophytica]